MRNSAKLMMGLLGGGGGGYQAKVLGISPSTLLAYWTLNELTGTTANDVSGNARHGSYTGVALDNLDGAGGTMGRAGLWDGVNDTCNIYSASLASAFNPSEGSLFVWFRVFDANVWTDGTIRYVAKLSADASNLIYIRKNSANNTVAISYTAGGTAKTIFAAVSNTNWNVAAITWSKSLDEMKAYLNGVQSGATQTSLGTWSGSLSATLCAIGANGSTPASVMNGYLHHTRVDNAALSAANIAALSIAA